MTVTPSDFVYVTLTEDQVAFCDKWANWRQDNAERAELGPHNNAPVGDAAQRTPYHRPSAPSAPSTFISAARAASSGTTTPVSRRWLNGIPDIEDFIDVKGRREGWHDLMVGDDDPPDWAYVLVRCHEHPRYEIVGWCWGREALLVPMIDPAGGRPSHFITQDDPIMKPISELLAEVKRRQAPETFAPGFVGYNRAGHFVHFCQCGVWGGFGYGVSVRTGKLGTWYCAEHNPERRTSNVRAEDGTEGVGAARTA